MFWNFEFTTCKEIEYREILWLENIAMFYAQKAGGAKFKGNVNFFLEKFHKFCWVLSRSGLSSFKKKMSLREGSSSSKFQTQALIFEQKWKARGTICIKSPENGEWWSISPSNFMVGFLSRSRHTVSPYGHTFISVFTEFDAKT